MSENKRKVQPDPEFPSGTREANAAWTTATGGAADGTAPPTGHASGPTPAP